MKRKLLTMAALLAAAVTTATAGDFTLDWHHTLDSNPAAADNALELAKAADGNYLVLNTWGSTTFAPSYQNAPDEAMSYYIDGSVAKNDQGADITGNPYTDGTSYNANIALQKVDPATGAIQWIVYSDRGESLNTYCHVQPTKDGGAYLQLYARHWGDTKSEALLRLNGTNGSQVTLDTDLGLWTASDGSEHNFYVPVLAKISSAGEVEWAKVLFEPSPVDGLRYFPSWLSFTYAFAIDNEDNVYVTGNYRTTLTFTDKSGGKTSITAQNVVNWTGDDQSSVGDFYLAKFDKDGNYLSHVTAEGSAVNAFGMVLAFTGDQVVVAGHTTGNGSSNSLGGYDITAVENGQSLFVAGFDTDLHANFARTYNNNGNVGALHINGLQALNGNLYLTGSILCNKTNVSKGIYGCLLDGADEFLKTATTFHTGYIVKLDPEDGGVQASVMNENKRGISKYDGVFEGKEGDDKVVYAFGYEFNAGAVIWKFTEDEANKAFVHDSYIDAMLRGIAAPNLGTIGVCAAPLSDNGRVVLLNRWGKANTANFTTTFYGGEQATAANAWSVALYSFTKDDLYVTETLTLPAEGYATYYSQNAFIMPEGLEGAVVTDYDGTQLTISYDYQAGDVVPAGTALLLKGEAGSYLAELTQSTGTAPAANLLHGSLVPELTEGGNTYYKLAAGSEGVGFYYGAANGGAFENSGHKAYLALNTSQAAKFFNLNGQTNAISTVNAAEKQADDAWYTLGGQRVSSPAQKGIYVRGGKKVVVK